MNNTDLKKGDWVMHKNNLEQVVETISDKVCLCRYAGSTYLAHDVAIHNIERASLIPDFNNAKIGDKCFSSDMGLCIVSGFEKYEGGNEEDYFFIETVIVRHNCKELEYQWKQSYIRDKQHPSLFNSFAQFKAYWAEWELNNKGENQ